MKAGRYRIDRLKWRNEKKCVIYEKRKQVKIKNGAIYLLICPLACGQQDLNLHVIDTRT